MKTFVRLNLRSIYQHEIASMLGMDEVVCRVDLISNELLDIEGEDFASFSSAMVLFDSSYDPVLKWFLVQSEALRIARAGE